MHLKSLLKTNALVIILILAISFSSFAQAPNLLNYQGVARNTVGNPLPNKTMKLRLSVHDLLPSGAVVYSEIRQITTNLGGLFSVQIGSAGASSSTGTIAGVNWLVGNKFLQVELDPASNNNYLDIGTVQLVSVPYSFAAGSAANVKTNANLTGVVTSIGNQTSIANGAITSDMIGTLNKSKVGLDLVNNTSDASKPISDLTQAALDLKLNTTGNAATATKLATSRKINNVDFDGSVDITITAVADAGALTGTILNSTVTGSSLTSVGTITSGTWAGTTIAIANGGTGATIAADALTNLGAESITNKSTNITTDALSTTKYPSIKLIKDYVDAQSAAAGVADGSITSAKIKDGDIVNADVSNTAAIAYSKLNLTGAITNGDLAGSITASKLVGTDIATVGTITAGTWNGTTIAIANGGTGLTSVGTNGQVLTSNGTAIAWVNPAATGITAINGITSGTQSLTVGTAGTEPAFSSVTSTHTLNLPMASTTNVTAGLLSKADYDLFNAKQAALTAGSGISISAGTISATGLTTSNLSESAGITNGQLANSLTTIGTTSIALGSSATTIAGLTSVTSTGFTGELTGNAATATKLATARNINGVAFDGSGDITVTVDAGTLSGTTLNSTITGSSLTSVGTITSGTWSGTAIDVPHGGTGATTKTAAFDALSPMTTAGDIIYGGTSGTGTRLAKGSDGQVLTIASGVPAWAAAAAGGSSVTEVSDEVASATVGQTSFTLAQTPAVKSIVKMLINGIRISNTAFTISANVVTYNPANNEAYNLSVGDRIQFDYYY